MIILIPFKQLQFDLDFGNDKVFEGPIKQKRKRLNKSEVNDRARKLSVGRCECGCGGFELSALRGGDLLRTCKKCRNKTIL